MGRLPRLRAKSTVCVALSVSPPDAGCRQHNRIISSETVVDCDVSHTHITIMHRCFSFESRYAEAVWRHLPDAVSDGQSDDFSGELRLSYPRNGRESGRCKYG
jgi:hypothetical protein